MSAFALRTVRQALNLSQSQMAHVLGCNQSTVSRIERGKQEPLPENQEAITNNLRQLFGTSLKRLQEDLKL